MKKAKVVIGANYGDEGKGLMTDYFAHAAELAHERCIVVCSNGGSQRGHTVVTPNGERHVFHHFGSGSFCGADTYLSEDFIVNPLVFEKEYREFQQFGHPVRIYVNGRCRFTTPFDMFINQIAEESRGEKRHGSCGIGIWETIVRYETFSWDLGTAISMKDEELTAYLLRIRDEYLPNRLRELGVHTISREWEDLIGSDGLIRQFLQDFRFMCSKMKLENNHVLNHYDTLIFENGQGLLLDQNIKEFNEHTTPSNTGLENPKKIINNVFEEDEIDVEVCYVTRTYLTRHGAGPLPTECAKECINSTMTDLTNVPNPHQGTLRYGWLREEELKKRILDDFGKQNSWELSAAVTHINEYDAIPEITFAKKYVSDGETRESVREIA